MPDDRNDQTDRSEPNVARDTDGRGAANQAGRDVDPNTEAVTDAFEGRGNEEGGSAGLGPDAIDLQDMNGASRREPGR